MAGGAREAAGLADAASPAAAPDDPPPHVLVLDHMHGVPYGSLVEVPDDAGGEGGCRYVAVQELRRGALVRTGAADASWGRVLGILATEVPLGAVGLCRVGGARVAPRQLVRYGGAWRLPCAHARPVVERCGCLLQVILEPPAVTLVVDGVVCKALGAYHRDLSSRIDVLFESRVVRTLVKHGDDTELLLSGYA